MQRIIEALLSGGGDGAGLPEELETELTPEVLARIEVQLIKAVMANGQLKVSECVCVTIIHSPSFLRSEFVYSPIPIPHIPIPIHAHLQIVDGVCSLKGRVYSGSGDEAAALLHRYDFEWLLEAVVKVHVRVRAHGVLFSKNVHIR